MRRHDPRSPRLVRVLGLSLAAALLLGISQTLITPTAPVTLKPAQAHESSAEEACLQAQALTNAYRICRSRFDHPPQELVTCALTIAGMEPRQTLPDLTPLRITFRALLHDHFPPAHASLIAALRLSRFTALYCRPDRQTAGNFSR